MGENYGPCRTCGGLGQVPDPEQLVDKNVKTTMRELGSKKLLFVTKVQAFRGKECDECGGTGQGGNAEDSPDFPG